MRKLADSSWQIVVGVKKPNSIYQIPSTNNCGLAVYYVRASCAQTIRLTHRQASGIFAWVQSYVVVDSLYNKLTQLLHRLNVIFQSVISYLYPLSTQPIKTTTNLFT